MLRWQQRDLRRFHATGEKICIRALSRCRIEAQWLEASAFILHQTRDLARAMHQLNACEQIGAAGAGNFTFCPREFLHVHTRIACKVGLDCALDGIVCIAFPIGCWWPAGT